MKVGKEYIIPLKDLKEGCYHYDFEISKAFFKQFPSPEVRTGELAALVELVRRSSFIELHIAIDGFVEVLCDRCLEYYNQPVHTSEKLFIKFGQIPTEESSDVIVISQEQTEIDLAQYFYEYIMLALPYRKIHPVDENGVSMCNSGMLDKLDNLSADHQEEKFNVLREALLNSHLNN